MKLKKKIIVFCLMVLIEIPFNNLFSQTVQTKPTRQSSIEAFSQGNYEKAYTEFRELLVTYSKDPMYQYYSGVCLVKLNRDPGEAIKLLQQALSGTGTVKTLPADAIFYLGRAQQMSGKFTDASQSYNLYIDRVGKKTAKEMGVPDLLDQCNQKKGQLAENSPKPSEALKINKADSVKGEIKPAVKTEIPKPVEKAPSANVKLPSNYDKILGEAIEFQFKADSLSAIVNSQKKDLEKLSGSEKSALYSRLLENEKLASSYQNSANAKYHEAQLTMNPKQDSPVSSAGVPPKTEYKDVTDSAKKTETKPVKTAEKKPDTTRMMIPAGKQQMEVFSFFDASEKPANDPSHKIIIDPEVPQGLIYRIQLAVFRNPVAPGYFKGITPIYGFKIEGTDKIIYYAGMFRKSADAGKALKEVKAKGFKDSFVAPLIGNKRVSSDRAASLEKESGGTPFYSIEKTVQRTKADTITPTLTFRVEVVRTLKPLTEDVVEVIRKVAAERGLDIKLLEDGKIDYLIGNFITFETAAAYSDLLKRNGYSEAKVVAWLGNKEIPIESAKQLIEKLK
jgi:tetratricopeptide (TPR) repeat protein